MRRSHRIDPPPAWRWSALIAIVVIAAFANGLNVPFHLDDEVNVVGNESIRRLTPWSAVLWPRTEVFTAGRPLLNLSLALNYAIGGRTVTSYHVTNILIHTLAALTLFGIVRRTLLLPRFGSRFAADASSIAGAAALLWALQPLQTESVTYVSQRAESLMGLCYLGALFGFIRAVEKPGIFWPVLAVIICGAGMLVKEVMVTAPVLILLFDRTFVAGSFAELWRRRRGLHLGLAATWLVLFALMSATRIGDRGVGYGFDLSWHQYLRIECTVVLHYLRLALLPFGLVFDYGEQVGVPALPAVVVCALALTAMAIGVCVALRRGSPIGFLGCWFFLILAPTSSVLPVAGQPIAENRLYVPLAAVSVALATGTFHVLRRRSYVALAAVAAGFVWLTVARNHDYRSELALWTDTVRKRPESSRAWCYHGIALMRVNRMAPAAESFQAALRISPDYAQAHSNLGGALLTLGRFDEAIAHFQTAIRLKPNDPLVRSNLGTALFQADRKVEALQQYQEALRIRPDSTEARVNMGIVLGRLGRFDEAAAAFEETLRQDPHNQAAQEQLRQLRAAMQRMSRPAR